MLLPVEDLLLNWPMLSYSLSTPYFPTLRIKWYSCYIPDDLCLGITNYKMVKIAKMNAAQSRGLLQHPVTLGTKMNSSVLADRKEWDPIPTLKVDQDLWSAITHWILGGLSLLLRPVHRIAVSFEIGWGKKCKTPTNQIDDKIKTTTLVQWGGPTYGSSIES